VEDDAIAADGFQMVLEHHGFHVVGSATNRSDAVRIARAERPDLVLMDLQLDDGKTAGLDAAAEIRADGLDVPIIYATALNPARDLSRAENRALLKWGQLWFLTKPITDKQLIATVGFALARKGPRVFISYSHKDSGHLEMGLRHLSSLEAVGIDVWADTKLKPGIDWRQEIYRCIDSARFAVLLVSADFQCSKFITEFELPRLLRKARKNGTQIVPLVVEPVQLLSSLSEFQVFNGKALGLTKRAERDSVWSELTRFLRESIRP
jgi:CheY-like chemotaxis protein